MKNSLCLFLAMGVVVFSATELLARGGGGGGRGGARSFSRPGGNAGSNFRSGGGARDGIDGKQFGEARERDGERSDRDNKAANFTNQFVQKNAIAGKHQPFTAGWYANHPRAWQYTHPHADAWAVATLGGAAAWLGLQAISNDGTVYTAETDDQGDDESDSESGEDLAEQGDVELPADEKFLPLGVFALSSDNQKDATALVQLAVSKDGVLRGTYYDLLTDQEQAIQGAVDKKSQRVAFTVGDNGPVLFETSLANLTQAKGTISLQFANGKSTKWNLSRYNGASTQK